MLTVFLLESFYLFNHRSSTDHCISVDSRTSHVRKMSCFQLYVGENVIKDTMKQDGDFLLLNKKSPSCFNLFAPSACIRNAEPSIFNNELANIIQTHIKVC